jgi:nucleoside-diphosphate-sugar epimerase
MKTILTGTSGFVHQNLSKYLESHNYQVQSLSLRNADWKKNFDNTANAIVHLVGKAHDTKNTSNASEYFAINTELTKQVFDLFLESDIQDFIYFSSVKAAADTVDNVLDENIVTNPKTPYGQSKLAAEQYILSKNIPSNKRIFIIRPCMIHGPGNKGNLNLLYKIVSKRIPWPLGTFENQRSFLSIDNLNFLMHQMLENKNVVSGIYNFADDNPISTTELIVLINQSLGKKTRILNFSKKLITQIATVGDFLKLPLNSEKLKKLTENYVVSNQKIKSALQINSLPSSAKNGLMQTLLSFR